VNFAYVYGPTFFQVQLMKGTETSRPLAFRGAMVAQYFHGFTVRVVMLPVVEAASAKQYVDFSDYEAVVRYFGLDSIANKKRPDL